MSMTIKVQKGFATSSGAYDPGNTYEFFDDSLACDYVAAGFANVVGEPTTEQRKTIDGLRRKKAGQVESEAVLVEDESAKTTAKK